MTTIGGATNCTAKGFRVDASLTRRGASASITPSLKEEIQMKNVAIMVAAAATAISFGVAGAFAADDDFMKADANNDKTVSWTEAFAEYPTLVQAIFDQADANKDGVLDEGEYAGLKGLVGALGGTSDSSSDASSSSSVTPP